MSLRELAVCLSAAFLPVVDDSRAPIVKSRSVKDAIKRMEHEAEGLEEVAGGHRPFCGTIKTVGERMR